MRMIMFGFGHKKGYYKNPNTIVHYSSRYNKFITVEKNYPSDGATGAIDVCSRAWFVHDRICDTGTFDDGTLCNNWQASRIISDILKDDCSRPVRSVTWFLGTWLGGGGKARDNGMW